MKPKVRSFALFTVFWAPACVVLFLLISGFTSAWDGKVVSVRSAHEDLPKLQVLVVTPDDNFEAWWPREALVPLDLAIDPLALPVKPLPDDLPTTHKDRFTLSFTLADDSTTQVLPTATPQTFGLALLAFFLGLLGRNMVVAGNPFSLEPRGVELVKAQPSPGSAAPPTAPTKTRNRGRKGPPPPKRRRGSGRRR